jgi:hypothetical protein
VDDALLPFRRRLTLRRPTPATAEGELEDHIHHVAVTVSHHDGRVTGIEGRGVRLPWTSCPNASAELAELVGHEVGATPRVADRTAHCTHLLDCAFAVVRFAGSDALERHYDVVVDAGAATARRDDGLELVIGIDEPVPPDLDPDRQELARLATRARWMRHSTTIDLDDFDELGATPVPPGSCYASQPQRIELARRARGSSLRSLPDA